MERFAREDDAHAQHFVAHVVTLDPTCSRVHAGPSFIHWQNALQAWADPVCATERDDAAAAESLLADEKTPAAHLAMGRAQSLRRAHGQAVEALRQSVDLSPNFALGHHPLASIVSQTGDPLEAIATSGRVARSVPTIH